MIEAELNPEKSDIRGHTPNPFSAVPPLLKVNFQSECLIITVSDKWCWKSDLDEFRRWKAKIIILLTYRGCYDTKDFYLVSLKLIHSQMGATQIRIWQVRLKFPILLSEKIPSDLVACSSENQESRQQLKLEHSKVPRCVVSWHLQFLPGRRDTIWGYRENN